MLPVTDSVRAKRFPFVNIAIIIACTVVFIYELSLSTRELDVFLHDYAIVPAELKAWWNSPNGWSEPATVITAAFLHGGWLHLGGNMLYLWVFGDNVEDALGHIPYLLFYLASAVGAALLQIAFDTDSAIPTLGASGAIAGVLAGYLILYPRASVGVFILIFFVPVPAFLLIGFWFGMQLLSGIATIGATEVSEVAFWAHVGGFLTGLALMGVARPFIPRRSMSEMRPRMRRTWR